MMSFTIGEVLDIQKTEYVFEWRINDFFSLSERNYASPTFNFDGETWHLIIYPNFKCSSTEYVDIFLCREFMGPCKSIFLSFALKTEDGKKHNKKQYSELFQGIEKNEFLGSFLFLERSKLIETMSSDLLTVVCTIFDCSEYPTDEGCRFDRCSYCKIYFHVSHITIHEEMCLYTRWRCPTCEEKWDDHECQELREKDSEHPGNETLRDFEEIFLSEEYYDVILKVNEQEFRAHKAILCARSSVFAATFRHDMKEKATVTINVEDCDPACFRDFLCFLYCGKLKYLSTENVFGLFTVADKYDVQELRSKCLEFIKTNLSANTFCDTLTVALKPSGKELNYLLALFLSKHEKSYCGP